MDETQLTSNIGKLREKRGMTQRELSQLVGVTETTIANWERGRSGLDWITKIRRLCQALGCRLEDLLTDPSDLKPIEPADGLSLDQLVELYNTGKLVKKEEVDDSSGKIE